MARRSGYYSDSTSSVQNAIKSLAANIRFATVDNPAKSIVVTSALPGEGKSTISKALGEVLAANGQRVIVVECDTRRRSMSGLLGIHPKAGIYAVIAGTVPLAEAIARTSTPGLYFLDAEPHIPGAIDLFATKQFKRLMEQLRNNFDAVIYDTPPLTAFIDAAVLGSSADATVLVVRRNYSRRSEIAAAVDQLKISGANIAGFVLNHCEAERSEYYYNYYNKDGKKVRSSKGRSSSPLPSFLQGGGASAPSAGGAAVPAPTVQAPDDEVDAYGSHVARKPPAI